MVSDVDECFNAGPSHYSATRSEVDLTGFNNVRFEWNQCTDGGIFQIYIWPDINDLPGSAVFQQVLFEDFRDGWNHAVIPTSGFAKI